MTRTLLLIAICAPLFGQSDEAKRELTARFAPSFLIAADDCAVQPAEFRAGTNEPEVLVQNGTVYTQVLSAAHGALEIHYYHLWSRDCGRMGHPLDAEHVSVLLRHDGSGWKAAYWFAAAHEDTLCDNSHAIPAERLHAAERGPTVWISKDKHASFLMKELCDGGCGRDVCDRMLPLAARLTMLDASARWIHSAQWPLAAKMSSNFSEALVSQLDASSGEIAFSHPSRPGVKGVVRVSDTTASAIMLGPQQTGYALRTSANAVRRSLRAAVSWLPN